MKKIKLHQIWNLSFCLIPFGIFNNSIYELKQSVVNSKISSNVKDSNETDQTFVSTCTQQLACHYSGWDTNVDGIEQKQIKFNQSIKRVFIPSYTKRIRGTNAIKKLDQLTKPSTDGKNTGTYRWGDNEYDKYERIQDWKYQYEDYLNIQSIDNKDWGLSKGKAYLETNITWPINTSFHDVVGKVVFSNGDDQSYEYKSARDFDLHIGVNRNFDNKTSNLYGIPYTKLKEVQYVYVVNNFVRRYLWFLTGNEPKINSEIKTNDFLVNTYAIKDLICLTNPNHEKGTVQMKFNKEFIDFAYSLENICKKYNETNWKDYPDIIKQSFDKYLQNCYISTDNYDTVLNTIKNISDPNKIEEIINDNKSSDSVLYNKYQINYLSDSLTTIKSILNYVNVKLDYKTPNALNPSIEDNITINITNEELKNGKDINLNKNKNGEYQITIVNLISDEYSDLDNYVGEDVTNNISANSSNLKQITGTSYILVDPKFESIKFLDYSPAQLENLYTYDLSDSQILNNFVQVIDSYKTIESGNVLNQNQYMINRQELDGNVEIVIRLNNKIYRKTYDNFKKPNLDDVTFNANTYKSLIYPSEINELIIKNIMQKCSFDKNIIDRSKFTITDIDMKTGIIQYRLSESLIDEFYEKLKNKIFKITNLVPYYIEQNKTVDKKYLNMQPKDITEEIFINKFINASKEFLSVNNLKIKLTPNTKNHCLIANISYTDYFDKQEYSLEYKYDFNKKSEVTKLSLIILIVCGGLIMMLGTFFYKKDNLKKLNS